jgi:hypothetical protein
MSPHQAVAVAVRLFSAWLGTYVLRTVPAFYFESHRDTPGLLYALLFFVLTGILVLALWFFPMTIAGKLLTSRPAEAAAAASPDLWLAMGCALIGLWMLTSSVPAVVRDAYAINFLSSEGGDTSEVKQYLTYQVVQVAIGLWLVFGAKGFRRLFWWARTAGYGKA